MGAFSSGAHLGLRTVEAGGGCSPAQSPAPLAPEGMRGLGLSGTAPGGGSPDTSAFPPPAPRCPRSGSGSGSGFGFGCVQGPESPENLENCWNP